MFRVDGYKSKNVSIKGLKMDFKKINLDTEHTNTNYPPSKNKKVSVDYSKLREWDFKLLSNFKPFYAPLCNLCCLCTYGKCDLSKNKKGGCGINLEKQQARIVLLACCIGASTHAAHARHIVDHILEENPNLKINYGNAINIVAPLSTTITGITPKTADDLDKILVYVEREITNLLAATHTGQEGSYLDFESKALHTGMIDNLALEIAELAQINYYNLHKGEPNTPLIDIGLGVIDDQKPIILCIGHNIAPGVEIIDYIDDMDLSEDIEVCGLCCTAIDISRYSKESKIVGPISRQLMFIKSGIPDIVVLDEQCIRADILELCAEQNIPIIATSDKCSLGLIEMTSKDENIIIHELLSNKHKGALIKDMAKVGKVAVGLALLLKKNQKPKQEHGSIDISELINGCTECEWCNRVCPAMLPIKEAFVLGKNGDLSGFSALYGMCVGCGKCMEECERELPIIDIIRIASKDKIASERFKIRAGRGPIQDIEIRKVGAPIVLGDIPGVIALAGCSNYHNGENEIALITEEFLKRGYIVVAAGCVAMDIGLYMDKDGKTLYEKFSGDFDKGGILNVGPCVANAHAIGSAIKIANIFAKIPLENNFTNVADYILNRVGACVIAWGAMSQKAVAIATGANRWGIPAVVGPHSSKYRRLYLGESELREITDKRTNEKVKCEPAPLHLIYCAESMNECMAMVAKSCIRPNDTPKGRLIKLTHYVDIYKKYYGCLPDDLHLYIRNEREIPYEDKKEILKFLKEKEWNPRNAPNEPSIL
ncbi:CO dehydrogenase/acetyl-CoA synthase complex subunit alpha [Methanococcus aeolicus]|uniref:CO dehydrogenase/acetyl-CoA synthase complex subunit alpha n=1 Tax=Methanococcus aeolicus TaxID=42879 RepID=UPI0021CACE25|nr:CO dehydrogenase/acetyl-CoA synthase complex subunit alpha [Methanococcus aeolicus]UXM85334.1 CO dehydrogenase/acetyl-CoA synthase complex subunit alpha [Methanococcus aeolicus]